MNYLGFEGVWVPVEALLDGLLALLLVLQVVEAVVAVAVEAELPVGEAVAVQLQALRLGAVARLPRPHPRRLERARVVRVGGSAHRRRVAIARDGVIPGGKTNP